MSNPEEPITEILGALNAGDPKAQERLLPLVYDELRDLAGRRMAQEPAGHTLQPTALLHEAYLRLVKDEKTRWANRAHYFTAAAEAMRRILIERARRYSRLKRGAGKRRVSMDVAEPASPPPDDELLALDETLTEFEERFPRQASVVKLRYFVGATIAETAAALDMTESSVAHDWRFARAWLQKELDRS